MADRNVTHLLKRSNVPGKIPTEAQLKLGEVALNTADAKMYTEYTGGATGATEVRAVGWDRLSTESGGTVNGEVFIDSNFSANTISIITTPTNDDGLTQILARHPSTGEIQYRNASSLLGSGFTDTYVESGVFSANTLTLTRTDAVNVVVTGFTSEDSYVTGMTWNTSASTLTLERNNGLSSITENINITNITGDTLIIDGKEVGDSLWKDWTQWYVSASNTATTTPVSVAVKVANEITSPPGTYSDNVKGFTYSAGTLTYTGSSTQQFVTSISMSCDATANNQIYAIWLDINGTKQVNVEIENQFNTQRQAVALTGIVEIVPNDNISVYVQNNTSNKDLFIRYFNLSMTQI